MSDPRPDNTAVATRSLSLWHDTLPADDDLSPRPALAGDTEADVAIVGAGYTGMWTAHALLERDPSLRIVIAERDVAGFGASGRNGGWASALLPMSPDAIASEHGADAAQRMQRAMEDSIDEVGRTSARLGIDCHFAKGGHVELVRNPAQEPRVRDALGMGARHGVEGERWLGADEARSRVGASNVLGAMFSPHCAAIHPARLARGLAASLVGRGVTLAERTTVTSIAPHRVVTDHGVIRADVVVRATEGFTPTLTGHRRAIAPIYSMMIATEPLSAAVWDEIGLRERETFNDARHMIIYGQRTADGRLAFGGRGAPYHFASAIKPEFDRSERVRALLTNTLVELFPMIRDAEITHHWGGPLGIPRDWRSGVGFDRATGMAWAGGYVGDGVTTTNLAGRTLADLITGRATDLTTLPWVGHRSRRWEPEPIRWVAIRSSLRLAAGADRFEQRRQRPERRRSWIINRLTSG